MSWGPVCWVLLWDPYPNATRGKALAIAVAAPVAGELLILAWTLPMIDKSMAGGQFPQRFLLLDLRVYGRSGSTIYVEICPRKPKVKPLRSWKTLWEPETKNTTRAATLQVLSSTPRQSACCIFSHFSRSGIPPPQSNRQ
ncbi:MFS transporter [Shigella flexneri]